MDSMFNRSRNFLALTSILILTSYGCGQEITSKIQEAWNGENNPAKMSLGSNDYEMQLDKLPSAGKISKLPWTSSYWPTYRGGISQRWFNGDGSREPATLEKQAGYELLTKEKLLTLSLEEKKRLSPSEKLDIFLGRYDFPLTLSERARTKVLRTIPNNPEYEPGFQIAHWMGLCHGWAPAAINFEEPKPVTVNNDDNIEIPFGSADIKAVLTYMEHAKPTKTNFLAGRCEFDASKKREIEPLHEEYRKNMADLKKKLDEGTITKAEFDAEADALYNSREKREEEIRNSYNTSLSVDNCRDTNAGAFHVVVTNQIALRNEGFIIDASRDYEVWNQPVNEFKSTIDSKFEGREEITTYLGSGYLAQAASGTETVVKVNTILHYVTEMDTTWNIVDYSTSGASTKAVYYSYYLELDAKNRIIGGRWIDGDMQSDRPDFMWKNSRPEFSGDFSKFARVYELATKPAQ